MARELEIKLKLDSSEAKRSAGQTRQELKRVESEAQRAARSQEREQARAFKAQAREAKRAADARLRELHRVARELELEAQREMVRQSRIATNAARLSKSFSPYGLGGAIGSAESLARSLGASVQMVGVVGGLAGAAQLAYPHVARLIESFAQGRDGADRFATESERLKDRIAAIEAKPVKLEIDRRQLELAREEADRLQKSLENFRALAKQQTRAEAESGQRVSRALVESPEDLKEAVRSQFLRQEREAAQRRLQSQRAGLQAELQELRDQAAQRFRIEMPSASAARTASILELEDRIAKLSINTRDVAEAAESRAAGLIEQARHGKGDDQAAAQSELIRRAREAGLGGVAQQIEQADIGQVRQEQRAEARERHLSREAGVMDQLRQVLQKAQRDQELSQRDWSLLHREAADASRIDQAERTGRAGLIPGAEHGEDAVRVQREQKDTLDQILEVLQRMGGVSQGGTTTPMRPVSGPSLTMIP